MFYQWITELIWISNAKDQEFYDNNLIFLYFYAENERFPNTKKVYQFTRYFRTI